MTTIEGELLKLDCGLWEVEGFQITIGTLVSVCLGGLWIQGIFDFDGRDYCVWGNGRTLYPVAGQRIKLSLRDEVK